MDDACARALCMLEEFLPYNVLITKGFVRDSTNIVRGGSTKLIDDVLFYNSQKEIELDDP